MLNTFLQRVSQEPSLAPPPTLELAVFRPRWFEPEMKRGAQFEVVQQQHSSSRWRHKDRWKEQVQQWLGPYLRSATQEIESYFWPDSQTGLAVFAMRNCGSPLDPVVLHLLQHKATDCNIRMLTTPVKRSVCSCLSRGVKRCLHEERYHYWGVPVQRWRWLELRSCRSRCSFPMTLSLAVVRRPLRPAQRWLQQDLETQGPWLVPLVEREEGLLTNIRTSSDCVAHLE